MSEMNITSEDDSMRQEYHFDYNKAKPNRFAKDAHRIILLDKDVAEVFKGTEQVNAALRALIAGMAKSAGI